MYNSVINNPTIRPLHSLPNPAKPVPLSPLALKTNDFMNASGIATLFEQLSNRTKYETEGTKYLHKGYKAFGRRQAAEIDETLLLEHPVPTEAEKGCPRNERSVASDIEGSAPLAYSGRDILLFEESPPAPTESQYEHRTAFSQQ